MTMVQDPVRQTASRVARPFLWYAVFANAVFQRGVFVLFLANQGLSGAQIGLLQAALFVGSAPAEIPTGVIADRFGRRASVVLGQLLVAAGLLGQLVFGGFSAFLALFVLMGLGTACISGAETALLYDLLKQRGAQTSYVAVRSRYASVGATSMALAIALGGWLQGLSWTVVYAGSALSLVVAALILSRVPEVRGSDITEEDETDAEPAGPLRVLRRVITPRIGLLVVASGLMHATVTPYFIFTQDVLASQGAPTAAVSVVMAVAFLLGGAAPLLAERVDRRFGVRVLFPLTLLVLSLALGVAGMGVVWLTIGAFLIGGVIAPDVTAVLLDDFFQSSLPSRYRAGLLSAISFVESGLTGLGYLALGLLFDVFGPSAGTAWYAVVPAVALLLAVPLVRRR
jgi:MFS family permease